MQHRWPARARKTTGLADLMQRYVDGDMAAFERLYAAIEPRIRGQIRARVGDGMPSEDLVQQTLLRAHMGRHGYVRPSDQADESLVAWFCAIARNVAVNALRSRSRERVCFGEVAGSAAAHADWIDDDPERRMIEAEHASERACALRTACATLSSAQRVVLEMHKLQGLPMAEISRRIGITEGTARVRAHRAYENLRSRMGR